MIEWVEPPVASRDQHCSVRHLREPVAEREIWHDWRANVDGAVFKCQVCGQRWVIRRDRDQRWYEAVIDDTTANDIGGDEKK